MIGWELFALSFQGDDERVWEHAEACLFYAYDAGFDRIKPYLDRMERSELTGVRELWAKICAISCLAGHIKLADFITDLKTLQDDSAWGEQAWSGPPMPDNLNMGPTATKR